MLLIATAAAGVLVLSAAGAVGSDHRAPRLVAAAMEDADGDSRADRVRLTYSERVRHRADRDGRYPFTVNGYRIRAIGPTSTRVLLIQLVEKPGPDPLAHPSVRYLRTPRQPVRDLAGNQAVAQLFIRTTARAHAPAPPPTPLDTDKDGTLDAQDCGPADASIHPGASDTPDLEFVDSNCDGIDGTETDAIFVADNGNDANPGTKAKPKREIQAAVTAAAAGNKRYVLVGFGDYGHVQLVTGISIYGGYDSLTWKRKDRYPDGLPLIVACREGVLALAVKDVTLQHIKVRGQSCGAGAAAERTAYGIRAVNSTDITLQRVFVTAGDGAPGATGTDGRAGANGRPGSEGGHGSTNLDGEFGRGGAGGLSSTPGHRGGDGGRGGGKRADGQSGGQGLVGTAGGAGGKGRDGDGPGKPGGDGDAGELGLAGAGGAGGSSAAEAIAPLYRGQSGSPGRPGTSGNGGGGGGGGGGGDKFGVGYPSGDGGGGGGVGGDGSRGGTGGGPGGGSFGIYLVSSTVTLKASKVVAGNGGRGGSGGDGGFGGAGGAGGKGSTFAADQSGAGGDGGHGGAGGRGGGGGGGAGGPSVGIFQRNSTASLKGNSSVIIGVGGAGGRRGFGGPGGEGRDGATGIAQNIAT
jgi:hypothetical protein